MKHYKRVVFLLISVIFWSGCSTKKNTFVSRNYHSMQARYNVFFNANESYKKGVEKYKSTISEDYSRILPVFYFSIHSFAPICAPEMNIALDKSKKTIQLHSIRKKPKRNRRKAKNLNYKRWYNSEEFNVMADDAFLMMGKSTFHKMEFLDALGIFNYTAEHFKNLPESYLAKIWMARCYAELNWLYEAEDLLKKINDESFPVKYQLEYSTTLADVMLKMNRFNEAIPYLKKAIQHDKNRDNRTRYKYIMAQIAQEAKDFDVATKYYNQVIHSNANYTMAFNAKIRLTEVLEGNENSDAIRKMLQRMLKDEKNESFYDQIYYALANIDLNEEKLDDAIKNYELSLENNTENKTQKGITLLTLGDLYFKTGKYLEAKPYYTDAIAALGTDYPGMQNVQELVSVLEDLTNYFDMISNEDSLQQLALLSDGDLDKKLAIIIEQDKNKPKKGAVGIKQPKEESIASKGIAGMSLPGISGKMNVQLWYFYNPTLVKKGARDFANTWGNRPLVDNWRRSKAKKANDNNESEEGLADIDISAEETTAASDELKESYLKNIPRDEASLAVSNNTIAGSLFAIGNIYKDNLEDYPQALSYYNQMLEMFPNNRYEVDVFFSKYRAYNEQNDTENADVQKDLIITNYPNSKYAVILSDPNYLAKLEQAATEQDSLYETAYQAFLTGDFKTVNKTGYLLAERYPDALVMPNMKFLQAFIVGKSGNTDEFKAQLLELVTTYPRAAVTPYAQEILDLIASGKTPAQGNSTIGSLITKRNNVKTDTSPKGASNILEEANKNLEKVTKPIFKIDMEAKHYVMIAFKTVDIKQEQLLYDIAKFNFNKFLIKDFDLSFKVINATETILIVNGFNGAEEAFAYIESLRNDSDITNKLSLFKNQKSIISDTNFRVILTQPDLTGYMVFYRQNYSQ